MKANEATVQFEQSDEEETIDLREYWRIFKRHIWSILGLGFLAAVLATLVVFSMDPIYKSTATLFLEPKAKKIIALDDPYDFENQKNYYQTQYELLTSRALVDRVVKRLKLEEHPEFLEHEEGSSINLNFRDWLKSFLPAKADNGKARLSEDETRYERLVSSFYDRMSINPIPRSKLVKISFEANDRRLASAVANGLGENYIEMGMEARLEMEDRALGWLNERLSGLKVKLEKAEKALQDYREKEQLVEVGTVSSLTGDQLQDLRQKLVLAEQERITTQTALRQVAALKGKSTDKLSALPVVLKDPLVASLKGSEADALRKVKTLSKRYGPKHPKLIQAKADLQEATANVRKQINSVISGLEKEYQVARANEQAIRQSMGSAKGEMQTISRKSYQLGILEREVEANRQLYELFLDRVKRARESEGVAEANIRIADPALPALRPIKPEKPKIVIAATAAGIFLGILLALVLEFLDNTFKRPSDLEDRLSLPLLGLLPHLKLGEKDEKPLHYARNNRESFFAESIRTLRTSVLLSGLDDPYKVILVTSSIPGEGKSTVAMNLTDSLSELHKVLLIDADMRRPTIAATWGLDKNTSGLSEFVSQTAKISECVHQINGSNIYVMPSGVVPPNPLELLSSKHFSDALDALGKSFDHIIIDSAPAMAVSDALVLSTYASGVVYVVKADSTPYPVAQDGIKRLRQSNAHLIGGVLNYMVMKKSGSYDYYGGNYYGSYGYTQQS